MMHFIRIRALTSVGALLVCVPALAQSRPSPTFQNLTVNGTLTVSGAFTEPPGTAAANLGAGLGTSGSAIGLLNTNNTYSGANTHTGSEGFTVSPTIPTPTAGDNSGKAAPTAFLARDYAGLASSNIFTAKQTMPTPTTGAASINLPHGVAPTSPVNGDMWSTSAGLFVRVNGATQGPFMAAGGAAVVLLNTLTASNSATLTDTTSISGSYTAYRIDCDAILPAANAVAFVIQVQQGGAFVTSGYGGFTTSFINGNTAYAGNADTADMAVSGNISNVAANGGFSGQIRFSNPASTGVTLFTGLSSWHNGTAQANGLIGTKPPAAAITGFRLQMSSGNIASGSCKVYGFN